MNFKLGNNDYKTKAEQFGHRKLYCCGILILSPTTDKLAIEAAIEREKRGFEERLNIQLLQQGIDLPEV